MIIEANVSHMIEKDLIVHGRPLENWKETYE